METNIETLFKDEEFCKNEIVESRKLFSNKNATFEQYENLIKGLMIMLVHCPENITSMVRATIDEAERRQRYRIDYLLNSIF